MADVRLVRLHLRDLDVMAQVRSDEAAAKGYPDAFGPAERVELAERIERSGEFVSITARLWEKLRGLQTDVRHTRTVHPVAGTPPA